MNYKIIRSTVSLSDLESLVNEAVTEGYQPEGAPFHNASTGQWIQSVWRPGGGNALGEIQIREKAKGGKR